MVVPMADILVVQMADILVVSVRYSGMLMYSSEHVRDAFLEKTWVVYLETYADSLNLLTYFVH